MTKTCIYCGADISRGEFCPKCGVKNNTANRISLGVIEGLFLYAVVGGLLLVGCVVLAVVFQ